MKAFKIVWLFLLLTTYPLFLYSQQHLVDSLHTLLKTDKEDSNKVNHLNSIAYAHYSNNPDSAILFARQANELAQAINYKKGEADAYRMMAIGYAVKGDYAEALEYFTATLKIAGETGNKQLQAKTLSNIGLVYSHEGEFPKALDYDLKALKLDEALQNREYQSITLNNIGTVYMYQKEYPQALNYYMKALDMDKKIGDTAGIADALGNTGLVCFLQGDYSKSLDYLLKSLKLDEVLGDKRTQADALDNIGSIYLHWGDYSKALDCYEKALKIDEEMGDKGGAAVKLGNIGSLYTKAGKFKEAEEYLKKAIAIDSGLGSKEYLRTFEEGLSQLYDTMGRYKLALEWYKKATILKDTLYNIDKNKAITRKEMNYEFEKKEAAEKADQDKKDALAEEDKHRQRIVTWSIAGGLILSLVFAGFVFRSLNVTRKQKGLIEKQKEKVEEQKTLIEHQKELVEEKNKDILDSITYAKRLQDAILPPIGMIEKYLPQSFVLYKPKDIVAGDFYWMERTESAILIAAADCTGHGVPGAMVSVVCSNALNRTVKEFHITEPGKILDKVRELVLETFEKSESNVQDGMDISLASIAPSNSPEGGVIIKWAGAYNSLWYISPSLRGVGEAVEMKELPADKQPIGKTDNPKPFTTHTITIPAPLSPKGGNMENSPVSTSAIPPLGGRGALYLFTDGYADQFGGPKGKKFKYKQLQELLLANASQPMNEQRNLLEAALEEWKGSLEQVDDILIIGIRV